MAHLYIFSVNDLSFLGVLPPRPQVWGNFKGSFTNNLGWLGDIRFVQWIIKNQFGKDNTKPYFNCD